MIKKILPIVLSLCLILGVSASAANTADNSGQSEAVQDMVPPGGGGRPGGGGMGGRGGMGGAPMGEMPNGEMPEGEMPEMSNGEMPEMPEDGAEMPQTDVNAGEENPQSATGGGNRMQRGEYGGAMDGSMQVSTGNENTETEKSALSVTDFIKTYSTPITSVILLIFAFIFVIFYKRKRY